MDKEQMFRKWKDAKSDIQVSDSFSSEVMQGVYSYQESKRKPLFDIDHLIELMSARPLAKAAMIVGGAVVGFVRVALMIHTVLFA